MYSCILKVKDAHAFKVISRSDYDFCMRRNLRLNFWTVTSETILQTVRPLVNRAGSNPKLTDAAGNSALKYVRDLQRTSFTMAQESTFQNPQSCGKIHIAMHGRNVSVMI